MRFFWIIIMLTLIPFLLHGQDDLSTAKISVEAKGESIPEILKKIEQKVKVAFSYNNSLFDPAEKKDLSIQNETLRAILEKLLPSDVSVIANDYNIILYRSLKKSDDISKTDKKEKNADKRKSLAPPEKLFGSSEVNTEVVTIKEKPVDSIFYIKEDSSAMHQRDDAKKLDLLSKDGLTKINSEINRGLPSLNWQRNMNPPVNMKIPVRFSLGGFYEILFENSRYQNLTIPPDGDFVEDVLKSNEKNILSNRMGMIGMVSFDRFSLTSGVAVLKSMENYRYKVSSSEGNDFFIDTTYFPVMDDTIGLTVHGENHYRYLSIPVFAGYNRNITEKVIIGAEAGVWINTLISHSGRYINLESAVPYRIMDTETAPLEKIRLDASLGLFVGYRFWESIYGVFSSSYTLPATSEFEKSYPVRKNKSAVTFKFAMIMEL